MDLEGKIKSCKPSSWNRFKLKAAELLFVSLPFLGCGGGGSTFPPIVTGPVITDTNGKATVEDTNKDPFDVIVKDEKTLNLLPDKTVYVIHHSEEVYVFDTLKNYISEFKILASNPINLEVLLSNLNDRIADSLPEYKTYFHPKSINWSLGTTKIGSNIPLSQLADFYEANQSKSTVTLIEVASEYWQISTFAKGLMEVRDFVIQNASDVAALIGLNPDEIFYDVYRENTTGILYHKRVSRPSSNVDKVAFVSNRNGNSEIYTMKSDGLDQINLTNNPTSDIFPDWSPDGSKIVFVSFRDSESNIYVMNADGTGQTKLAPLPSFDTGPQWSPSGNKIAFARREAGYSEIYVMNPDGSNIVKLTNSAGEGKDALYPQWSPDGNKISFVSINSVDEIYIMNSDGTGKTKLTDILGVGSGDFSWSPDGTKIAFNTSDGSDKEICVINSDGSGRTTLTDRWQNEYDPIWSPDGTKIAFTSYGVLPDSEVYVMDSNGGNQINLSSTSTPNDWYPQWSLDSNEIIFISDRDGNTEVYKINKDGTGRVNLTSNPAGDGSPVLAPK